MVKIIDASVAIKWFVIEEGRKTALAILSELLRNTKSFAVPELFYFELTHVFYKVIVRPSDVQKELLEQIMDLGIARFSMTKQMLKEASKYCVMGMSGYDSSYVALASLLQGKWLTFDKKTHNLIAHTKLSELLC